MTPRTYPGRDTARILRRAKSIQRAHAAKENQRANCCARPIHRELHDVGILTTRCENCGATV